MEKLKLFAAMFLVTALFAFAGNTTARAADHGDAPNVDNDSGADIADLFAFLDPNDNTQVVIIGTVHGFIVPGEAGNFAAFDPTVQFTFNLEQTGDAKPDSSILVKFSERVGSSTAPQTATIVLPGKGPASKRTYTALTTPATFAATPVPQVITPLGSTGIKFFAGQASDPFFFDIPGFQRFVASVKAGSPDPTTLTRGRNTFAGFNVLGIAFSFPIALIRGAETNNSLGVEFVTSRQTQTPNTVSGGVRASGAFKQVDRMGNPAVNVALIPFDQKSAYNAGTPLEDSKGKFASSIVATLKSLGTDTAHINALAGVAVTNGDYLRLNLATPNTGANGGNNTAAQFPNGRRLADDTIDILLTIIANGTPAPNNGVATGIPGLLGDSVDAAQIPPLSAFPFLALPNQPFPTGTIDDGTRN